MGKIRKAVVATLSTAAGLGTGYATEVTNHHNYNPTPAHHEVGKVAVASFEGHINNLTTGQDIVFIIGDGLIAATAAALVANRYLPEPREAQRV